MKKVVICMAVLALALPFAATAKSPIKAGKWETTVETEMPGMPMKMPPMKFTSCVTKEQAENPESAMPKGQSQNRKEKESNCKISNFKIDGNKITYEFKCEKENIEGSAEWKYDADSNSGVMHVKMGDQEMTQKYAGKRIGDCDEKK